MHMELLLANTLWSWKWLYTGSVAFGRISPQYMCSGFLPEAARLELRPSAALFLASPALEWSTPAVRLTCSEG